MSRVTRGWLRHAWVRRPFLVVTLIPVFCYVVLAVLIETCLELADEVRSMW
ncbi:MAG TPA: hypothetical protein VLG10_08125 [Methylomirabilota bacterium]|nr:hypothetical protein [Methylomirabilota bacterium]